MVHSKRVAGKNSSVHRKGGSQSNFNHDGATSNISTSEIPMRDPFSATVQVHKPVSTSTFFARFPRLVREMTARVQFSTALISVVCRSNIEYI